MYWELMWDERHGKVGGANVKLMPEVAGVMVLLSAARMLKAGEGKEEVGKFAERLVGAWGRFDLTVDESDWVQANHLLVAWAPVLQGMKLAQRVLGKESQFGKELGLKAQKELEPLLGNALATVNAHTPEGGTRRGIQLYEDLLQADL